MNIEECNICGGVGTVRKIRNKEIYGKKYGNGMAFRCDVCKSHVGCHDNGKPLGILSTKEMRVLKMKCHSLFDPIWKEPPRKIKRSELYWRLSVKLGIPMKECHFGLFDMDMLNKALSVLEESGWYEK